VRGQDRARDRDDERGPRGETDACVDQRGELEREDARGVDACGDDLGVTHAGLEVRAEHDVRREVDRGRRRAQSDVTPQRGELIGVGRQQSRITVTRVRVSKNAQAAWCGRERRRDHWSRWARCRDARAGDGPGAADEEHQHEQSHDGIDARRRASGNYFSGSPSDP
jgi:hypothetical protein